MAVAKTKLSSFFSWIIYLIGTVDSTQDVYRNIWAVKVRGSLQDAKQLSFKHGFVYEKHVSSSSLTLVKSAQNPFQYHHCIVETRIAKNGNCIIYQERKTRQAKTSRTKPFCSAAEWLQEALQESCNNAGCSSSKLYNFRSMSNKFPTIF